MTLAGLKPDPQYYIEHQLESPVGQLFSILVDQLPGAKPPPQGWNADPDVQLAERELYARDYLFKPAKAKNTNTLMKAWGITDVVLNTQATAITTRGKPKAPPVTRAEQLFLDQLLVANSKRKPKK
jgi:hypothetical protein